MMITTPFYNCELGWVSCDLTIVNCSLYLRT
jgi:hypothetical protein